MTADAAAPARAKAPRVAHRVWPRDAAEQARLAQALRTEGRFDAALMLLRAIVTDAPDDYRRLANLGNGARESGRVGVAQRAYRRALAIDPFQRSVRIWLGITHLLAGDLPNGFELIEERGERDVLAKYEARYGIPAWEGQPLAGRRILLHAEQGYGDTIQFVRYAAMLQALGAQVAVRCQASLVPLIAGMRAVAEVVPEDAPFPAADFQQLMISLPRVMGTTLATVPADTPYIEATARALPPGRPDARIRAGIVWAGAPAHPEDARRSCRLADLAPLLALDHVAWYSLQVGARATELARIADAHRPVDLAPLIADFRDTAEFIQSLDVVVSVDTSVAHLAGALGRPVLLLVHHVPEWRFMLDRPDTPWYPHHRLIRQPRFGDWSSVVGEVADRLRSWPRARA
jgi:hypothetical protein